MNILKILGIVVAVHIVAFFLMFVNPGCRSTDQGSAPVAGDTMPAAATPVGTAVMPAATPMVAVDTSAPPAVRYSPTRPGSAAASALESAPPPPVTPATTYTVVAGDSLWTIAKKHGTTVTDLAKANKLTNNSRLSIGQKLIIPGKAPAAEGGAGEPAPTATYKVRPGDTLSGIAHRMGTTAAEIKRANNLSSDYVQVGQELRLPGETAAATAAPAAASAPAASPAAPVKRAEGSVVHVVKPGETLGAIARKYQVKTQDLLVANNISDPRKIRAGQELVIPGYTAVSGAGGSSGAAPVGTPAGNAPAASPAPAATSSAAGVPAPDQDLDAGLKPQENVPVIKIEDAGTGTPKSP